MTLWPLLLHFVAVVALAGALLGVSSLLGERHRGHGTDRPYESGVASTGTARLRLSAHFYVVALLFVIFDLEVAFLFAWAIAAEAAGWRGYAGLLVFAGILGLGLLYEWRQGALDWATTGKSQAQRALARRARSAAT